MTVQLRFPLDLDLSRPLGSLVSQAHASSSIPTLTEHMRGRPAVWPAFGALGPGRGKLEVRAILILAGEQIFNISSLSAVPLPLLTIGTDEIGVRRPLRSSDQVREPSDHP